MGIRLNEQTSATDKTSNAKVAERKSGYIPTLDGWRTIAIGAVILYHARPIQVGPFDLSPLQNFGDRGVQLFFAISGILICSRLLEEQKRYGQISLRGFYLRRLFRIQPAALVFLFSICILWVARTIHPTLPTTLSAVFSYRNIWNALDLPSSPDDRYTVHFWSLAVEEQFYLMLPFLLVFARKRLLTLLLSLSLIALVWPPIAHHLGLAGRILSYQRTDLAIRDLLVPALLAVALTRPRFREWTARIAKHGKFFWVVLGAILISQYLLGGRPTSLITCIGFPLVILGTMLHPNEWMGRILESRVLTFGGHISYSLYLWQQLFFIHRPESSWLHFVQVPPVNILATLTLAITSYYLIEKPFMRLGHRLAPPATPGRKDMR